MCVCVCVGWGGGGGGGWGVVGVGWGGGGWGVGGGGIVAVVVKYLQFLNLSRSLPLQTPKILVSEQMLKQKLSVTIPVVFLYDRKTTCTRAIVRSVFTTGKTVSV